MARGNKTTIPLSIDSVSTKLVFSIYLLAVAFDGFICAFPGAIYVELQSHLNTSVLTVSWIYSALSIGYMISNAVCGWLTDQIKESHRLQSVIVFLCGIAVICVPFITNISFVFVLFVLIGIGWAANETHYVLFTFRLYPADGPKMFFTLYVVFTVFCMVTAMFIQFSISITGSYSYAFAVFGGIAIIHSIAVLFIETPKHDEYRAIKRRASSVQKETETPDVLDDDKLAEAASTKLKESKSYRKLQNVTMTLLMISMALHAAGMSGFLSFTTVYCRDYLHIDDKYGRYFITSYWAGSLLINIVRQTLVSNTSPAILVMTGNISRSILQVLFIPLSQRSDLAIPFLIMYGLCGLTTSLQVPSLISWAELIRSTTGIIACLWWVLYGLGTAAITISMGELIEQFGAKWIPFILCVPLFAAGIVNTIAVVTYKMIQNQESAAFDEVKQRPTGDPEETGVLETDTEGDTDTETVPPMA